MWLDKISYRNSFGAQHPRGRTRPPWSWGPPRVRGTLYFRRDSSLTSRSCRNVASCDDVTRDSTTCCCCWLLSLSFAIGAGDSAISLRRPFLGDFAVGTCLWLTSVFVGASHGTSAMTSSVVGAALKSRSSTPKPNEMPKSFACAISNFLSRKMTLLDDVTVPLCALFTLLDDEERLQVPLPAFVAGVAGALVSCAGAVPTLLLVSAARALDGFCSALRMQFAVKDVRLQSAQLVLTGGTRAAARGRGRDWACSRARWEQVRWHVPLWALAEAAAE